MVVLLYTERNCDLLAYWELLCMLSQVMKKLNFNSSFNYNLIMMYIQIIYI